MKSLKVAKWSSLILGVLAIITGVLFFFNPMEATVSIVYAVGTLYIVLGILRIIRYFSHTYFKTGAFLIGGILDIIIGVLVLRNTAVSTIALSVLVGFWVLVQGVVDIAASIDYKRIGISTWWLYLLLGILGIICGIILVSNVPIATLYMSFMVAFYMIAGGAMLISMFFNLSKMEKSGFNNF